MNERVRIIHQMSNHISNHLATRYISKMHVKLDDLHLQNTAIGSQLFGEMTQLQTLVQRSHDSSKDNRILLKAIAD